jgi:membrane fusion protein (multidrug efflux system)
VRIRVQASDSVSKLLLPGLSVTVQVDTRGARDEMKRLQREQSHEPSHE